MCKGYKIETQYRRRRVSVSIKVPDLEIDFYHIVPAMRPRNASTVLALDSLRFVALFEEVAEAEGVGDPDDDVPLSAMALALKASNVLALVSTAFTENTMPCPQCPAWRQYAQMGVV